MNRGAPRDFRDIYRLCHSGLCSLENCWRLWQQRKIAAGDPFENPEAERERARLAICTHLVRVAQARPAAKINDVAEQADAEAMRDWFAHTVCAGVWP